MKSIADMPASVARAVRGVLVDIDGTLTWHGKLVHEAYRALWQLQGAGLRVVPVTGRPAGWCDMIARQWPVDAVVGENGALAFWEQDRRLERLYHPAVAKGDVRARLAEVQQAILSEVAGSRVAKDQPFRLFDLAIDYREEAPDLGLEVATEIQRVFERHGATAKVSDIHVNGWFGSYDKLSMVQRLAQNLWQVDLADAPETFLFCGDSPNDEPMFAFFPHTCGVANLLDFAPQMTCLPTYLASGEGGLGFAEIVESLLSLRGQNA